MRVFVSNLDTPFGHNLSNILSQTFVGSRQDEDGGGEEDEAPLPLATDGETTNTIKEKPAKEKYTVVGSLVTDLPFESSHGAPQNPAKPAKMVETGDKKRDISRKEAIEKIPVRGSKPRWASDAVNSSDKEGILKLMLSSDVIVYDMMSGLEEANWAIEGKVQVDV